MCGVSAECGATGYALMMWEVRYRDGSFAFVDVLLDDGPGSNIVSQARLVELSDQDVVAAGLTELITIDGRLYARLHS